VDGRLHFLLSVSFKGKGPLVSPGGEGDGVQEDWGVGDTALRDGCLGGEDKHGGVPRTRNNERLKRRRCRRNVFCCLRGEGRGNIIGAGMGSGTFYVRFGDGRGAPPEEMAEGEHCLSAEGSCGFQGGLEGQPRGIHSP